MHPKLLRIVRNVEWIILDLVLHPLPTSLAILMYTMIIGSIVLLSPLIWWMALTLAYMGIGYFTGMKFLIRLSYYLATFGIFSEGLDKSIRLAKTHLVKTIQRLSERDRNFRDILITVRDWLEHTDLTLINKFRMLVSIWLILLGMLTKSLLTNIKRALTVYIVGFSMAILCIVYDIDLVYAQNLLLARLDINLRLVYKVVLEGSPGWTKLADGVEGYVFLTDNLVARLLLTIANALLESELILERHYVAGKKIKYSKVMRSVQVAIARFVDAQRVPQMVRNSVSFDFSGEDQKDIDRVLKESLKRLKEMGYPVDDVEITEAIKGIAGGKFDKDWLLAGSNWRIHQPTIKTYVQHEFDRFRENIVKYKYSLTYANMDNQLESIARYFANPDIKFVTDKQVVTAVWDVLKPLYKDSKIMPSWAILKSWNKKFNVGVFASSEKRNKYGGFRKLKRREWISRLGGLKETKKAFDDMIKYAYTVPTFAQFFTKLENLPPNKWLKDKIRTPVAAMLPQYLAQMTFAMEPNKRFLYEETPIKLGMPLKGSVMATLWERHSRFKHHFAGDCTAFDSTISGPVIELIKIIRKKGYEYHKEQRALEWLIDTTYERIEKAILVSANSGNVHQKGSGLMTGHASTSSDNSMVMVALYLAAWVKLTGRSAAEFKANNELSVYGDDHILSISELAPKVWNWNNIVKTMKGWNIEMREEVPSNGKGVDLTEVPFLKKFCRKPSSTDKLEWKEAFGDLLPPKYITYHDPISLVGKAMADVTNNNPTYRVKRLQSFLYLCAHHREEYDRFLYGIERIFNRNPNVRRELKQHTPSYNRVLQTWYSDNRIPINEPEPSDGEEDFTTEEEGTIYMFGEIGWLEKFLNTMSLVPDLITPTFRALNGSEYAQKLMQDYLGWPKLLLQRTNNTYALGHLQGVLRNSPYEFLSTVVPVPVNVTTSSLLVRHWIFMSLRTGKPRTFFGFFNGFQKKLLDLNFTLNGYVPNVTRTTYFPITNCILVAALSLINIPETPFIDSLILKVKVPDLVGTLDDTLSSVSNYLLNKIPTSFRDIEAPLLTSRQFLVVAPTGSGKSTDMVYYVHSIIRSSRPKVVVVVPRVNLAKGLQSYLSDRFVWTVGCWTGEDQINIESEVLFVTPGVVITHMDSFFNKRYQWVFDECHLKELASVYLYNILLNSEEYVLFTTATPSEENIGRNKGPIVELPSSNPFTYTRENVNVGESRDMSLDFLSAIKRRRMGAPAHAKILVFVDSFAEMDMMLNGLTGKSGSISSRGTSYDDTTQVIVATSSADVGVTVPNVDLVFTKDVQRTGDTRGVMTRRLDDLLIKQRCGRTGRTSNGIAVVVHFEGKHIKEEPPGVAMDELINFAVDNRVSFRFIRDNFNVPFLRDLDNPVCQLVDITIKKIYESTRTTMYEQSRPAGTSDWLPFMILNVAWLMMQVRITPEIIQETYEPYKQTIGKGPALVQCFKELVHLYNHPEDVRETRSKAAIEAYTEYGNAFTHLAHLSDVAKIIACVDWERYTGNSVILDLIHGLAMDLPPPLNARAYFATECILARMKTDTVYI
ncbi:RNA-dependent RNA polymerase [Rhizoctonia solani fusarivirus 1]|uniref:RNA-dependent RNA polymerase n=1 Tax=Rhizoctonia solani fusarivirus 1 TaxID=2599953 RepID=A0AAE6HX53_9VIRU|nr:RNA-dependent RNA polymerase [Rhizoctonia solani fusarivirus 1]QDW92695.1 RNA-dependent RNA polymerase [Rhizoctonia solani fusarivirus 1]